MSKSNIKNSLALLKAARSGNITRSDQIVSKDESLYDTITEDEYMKRVINGSSDFVVDENEFNDGPSRNDKTVKKQKRELGKPKNNGSDIDQMLKNQVSTSFNKNNILTPKHEAVDTKASMDNFLDDLLQSADSDMPIMPRITANKKTDRRETVNTITSRYATLYDSVLPSTSSQSPVKEEYQMDEEEIIQPSLNNNHLHQSLAVKTETPKPSVVASTPTKVEPTTTTTTSLTPAPVPVRTPFAKPTPVIKREAPAPSSPIKVLANSPVSSPVSNNFEWKNVVTETKMSELDLDVAKSLTEDLTSTDDYTIHMYWIDCYEDHINHPGTLYLFGKSFDPVSKTFVSCCVTLKNLERTIFVLPREHRWMDPNNSQTVTDIPVALKDVFAEFSSIFESLQIDKTKMKVVKRNYAFDKLAEGVPKEGSYLKIKYPAKFPPLQHDLKGSTFSQVFGTKSTLIEQLLVKKQLMGPCWITLTNLEKPKVNVSYCKMEFALESLKHLEKQENITVNDDGEEVKTIENVSIKHISLMDKVAEPPAIVVMSIFIQTYLQPKTHQHEIAAISCIVHTNVKVDGPSTSNSHVTSFTYIRRVGDEPFPSDLSARCKANECPTKKIEICNTESSLLNLFVAKVQQIDPDSLLCHGSHGFQFDILLNRMEHLNVAAPQRIGRLSKRTLMSRVKKAGRQNTHFHSNADVAAGRLIVDTEVSAKELINEKNYTLSELARTQLKESRNDIEAENVIRYYSSSENLMSLLHHCEASAWFTLQLCFKLMVYPLTKQLTEVCGNLWARSLQSQRSERNEFLLMHRFHAKKFICPDKLSFADRKSIADKKKALLLARKNISLNNQSASKKRKESEIAALVDDPELKAELELIEMELGNEVEAEIEEVDEDDDDNAGGRRRRKPAYSGGLVLEPKKGFYDKYVLLLDFNSLYPSIIQEYNLCFTTVQHYENLRKDGVPVLPNQGCEAGILPTVLKYLVERRRAVKQLMKKEKDEIKQQQLEIKQKAFKLVANSMYGCLGFPSSRFCCKPIAALITSQGREILQKTVDLVQGSMSLNVIYGDTDSMFVYTGLSDLPKVREIGLQIKKEVNKLYKLLELDLDGVFKSLLLLRKKKYAALKVVDLNSSEADVTTSTETKGLDLVRRDWCQLSKDIGQKVLDEIMSGQLEEDVVANIQRHLQKLGEDVRNNRISIGKYIITKGLTKDPKDYSDAKSQPHVQVALSMQERGKNVKAGDFIPYIVCKKDGNESGNTTIASRSYHPDDLMHANGKITIDTEWYLSVQILPPVLRLCEPIKGTDRSILAEYLGLDAKRYVSNAPTEIVFDDLYTTYALEDDDERFKKCTQLRIACPNCGAFLKLPGVVYTKQQWSEVGGSGDNLVSGLKCPKSGCSGLSTVLKGANDCASGYLICQITSAIREYVAQFSAPTFQCNDPMCATTTNVISLRKSTTGIRGNLSQVDPSSRPCSISGCTGRLSPLYSTSDLDLQLLYLSSIFDINRQIKKLSREFALKDSVKVSKKDQLYTVCADKAENLLNSVLTPNDKEIYSLVHVEVEKIRSFSAYNFVNLGQLFGHLSAPVHSTK